MIYLKYNFLINFKNKFNKSGVHLDLMDHKIELTLDKSLNRSIRKLQVH